MMASMMLFVALALPWIGVVRWFDLRATFQVNLQKALANVELIPMALNAFFLETLGPGITVKAVSNVSAEWGNWYAALRDGWGLFWYACLAAVVVGFKALSERTILGGFFVIACQLCATLIVFLGSQYSIVWLLVTSLDRLLLQVTPLVFSLAAGLAIPIAWPAPLHALHKAGKPPDNAHTSEASC